jgi:beta-carotene 15,15'-dioxygenase
MDRGPETRLAARRRLIGLTLWPAWSLILLVTLPFALGFQAPAALLYAPFAVSLLFLGLPHGAVDHLVPGWLSGGGPDARSMLGVAVLYAVLGASVVALWFAAPALAFGVFVLLTWFHWGTGDLYALGSLVGVRHTAGPVTRSLTVLVRGGLPMLVPLLAFPETYRAVAEAAMTPFGGSVDGLRWAFGDRFRMLAGSAFFAAIGCYLWLGFRGAGREGRRGWWLDAGEIGLLAAYFCLVPPVLAVGLYFCLWHSARHVARLMTLDPASAEEWERGRPLRAAWAFSRAAAPLTGAALVLLVGLYLAVPGFATEPASLLALYLVLLSALTLPHAVVVGYADLRQEPPLPAVTDRPIRGR